MQPRHREHHEPPYRCPDPFWRPIFDRTRVIPRIPFESGRLDPETGHGPSGDDARLP